MKADIVELRQQTVAQHFRGDAGAVGQEENGSPVGHYQRVQTGVTPAGMSGRSPRSSQLSPGP